MGASDLLAFLKEKEIFPSVISLVGRVVSQLVSSLDIRWTLLVTLARSVDVQKMWRDGCETRTQRELGEKRTRKNHYDLNYY